ncbi:hypothetical protein AALA82_05745 [Oscillospiraceae bacterium 50-16]
MDFALFARRDIELSGSHQDTEPVRGPQLGDGVLSLGQAGELLHLSSGDGNGLGGKLLVKIRLILHMEGLPFNFKGDSGQIFRPFDLENTTVLADIHRGMRGIDVYRAHTLVLGHVPFSITLLKSALVSLLNDTDFERSIKRYSF